MSLTFFRVSHSSATLKDAPSVRIQRFLDRPKERVIDLTKRGTNRSKESKNSRNERAKIPRTTLNSPARADDTAVRNEMAKVLKSGGNFKWMRRTPLPETSSLISKCKLESLEAQTFFLKSTDTLKPRPRVTKQPTTSRGSIPRSTAPRSSNPSPTFRQLQHCLDALERNNNFLAKGVSKMEHRPNSKDPAAFAKAVKQDCIQNLELIHKLKQLLVKESSAKSHRNQTPSTGSQLRSASRGEGRVRPFSERPSVENMSDFSFNG